MLPRVPRARSRRPIPAEHGDEAAPRRGGTLQLASFKDIRGLDPAGPTEGLADQAIHLIFAGLVDFDAEGRVVPDLADHWEVDGRRAARTASFCGRACGCTTAQSSRPTT